MWKWNIIIKQDLKLSLFNRMKFCFQITYDIYSSLVNIKKENMAICMITSPLLREPTYKRIILCMHINRALISAEFLMIFAPYKIWSVTNIYGRFQRNIIVERGSFIELCTLYDGFCQEPKKEETIWREELIDFSSPGIFWMGKFSKSLRF